jgi:hypothetical protein
VLEKLGDRAFVLVPPREPPLGRRRALPAIGFVTVPATVFALPMLSLGFGRRPIRERSPMRSSIFGHVRPPPACPLEYIQRTPMSPWFKRKKQVAPLAEMEGSSS